MTTGLITYTAFFVEGCDHNGCLDQVFTGLVTDSDTDGLAKARAEAQAIVDQANAAQRERIIDAMPFGFSHTEADVQAAIDDDGGRDEMVERSGLVLTHHLPDGIDEDDDRVVLAAKQGFELNGYAYAIEMGEDAVYGDLYVTGGLRGMDYGKSWVASRVGDMLDDTEYDEGQAVSDVDEHLAKAADGRGISIRWEPHLEEIRFEFPATLDLDGEDPEEVVKEMLHSAIDSVAEDLNCA